MRGHYVTDVVDPITGKWQHFNDTIVSKTTESAVLGNKRDTYLLFYVHDSCWPKS